MSNKAVDRPYVFCHMLTSIDGKIMGSYMDSPEANVAGDVFYNIAFGEHPYYKHQGWLSGRITTDDNFMFYKDPVLDPDAATVAEGNFIATQAPMYYVSIDPSGRLGWESSTLAYGTTHAHIIEVLTEQASNAYKAFLRNLGISYIIAGESQIDFANMLMVLKNDFGMETIMLGGGGILNWSFIEAGLCDELSLVIASSADGANTPALFATKEGLSKDKAIGFSLEHMEKTGTDCVWLRYKIKNEREEK